MSTSIVSRLMALADAYANAKAALACATDDSTDDEERGALLAAVEEIAAKIEPPVEVSEGVSGDIAIPPITSEMGCHWRQPDRSTIQVTDKLAIMPNATFTALSEYSSTIPSGVYDGKMWRRFQEQKWHLCWFAPSTRGIANECSIMMREIHIHPRVTS